MCQIWSRSVQRFGIFPTFLNLWPPNPLQMPLDVSRGYFFLTYIHSQMNLHMCAKFGPDRSSCLGSILNFWICDPLTPSQMPLGVSSPLICLAYVHSQMNLHTCAEFGPDRSSCLASFLHFWICDPLTPYKCPLMSRGVTFFNLHQFRDESAYVCHIWSRSVQWFGIFPRFVILTHKPPKMPPGLSWGQFF